MQSSRAKRIFKLATNEKGVHDVFKDTHNMYDCSIPTTVNNMVHTKNNINNGDDVLTLSNLPVYSITEDERYKNVDAWLESQQPSTYTTLNTVPYISNPETVSYNIINQLSDDSVTVETEKSDECVDNGSDEDPTFMINTIDRSSESLSCIVQVPVNSTVITENDTDFYRHLPQVTSEPKPISKLKYKDLQTALKWVPRIFHDFYTNMKYDDKIADYPE